MPSGAPVRVYGRYEILGEIARGGMGIVYLARLSGEGGFSRLFGLKVMHQHLAEQDGFARLMMREAKLAASIHHPNVVGTVDFGTHEGSYFMLLDYIEGMSLGHALKADPNAPPRFVVPCVIDALQGLHAAHTTVDYDGVEAPIVHQDVSPDNILVGIDGIGRITDFGIAREVQQTTYAGNPKGKAAYMSPEQLTGRRVDVRADLWSMGVVLWNVLTGERLFTAATAAATIYNVLHQEIPAPSTVGLKPPKEFDEVVLRALAREQDERYSTAAEMAEALERAAKQVDALAPRTEVGRWVVQANPDELKRRRDMVKRAGAPGAALAAVSGAHRLTQSNSGPLGLGLTPPVGLVTAATVALDGADLDPHAAAVSTTPAGGHTEPEVRPRKVSKALTLTVIVASVAIAAFFALRAPDAPPVSASAPSLAPSPAPAAPVRAVEPTPLPPQAAAPAPSAEPTVAAPAAPEPAPEQTSQRAVRPARPARGHAARPAPQGPASGDVQPVQPVKPAAVQMEANPYLRQD